MKKIISKILIIFIIMVILFEFIYSSNISYAFDSEDINSITNLIGGIVSILLWIPRILTIGMAWLTGKIMTVSLAESCGVNDTVPIFQGTAGKVATPFDIFFNKYKLFDVNFFDITTEDNIINTIRIQVAQWFYIFRTLAAAILLIVLVYVGIRMALSTIAEDKAKYKKMLFDWCSSLALVFVLQYIAIFTIYANNAIVNFLRDFITQNGGKDTYNQVNAAIDSIVDLGMGGMGIGSIVATFAYCMIVFQTISFMLMYIQRMLKVGFLLIIAPLISITYSIDKMGDGKAQALNSWLKEYVYTILIQPFHCIMYLAFVNTAMKLLASGADISGVSSAGELWDAIGNMNQLANGFLAILCLKFINDGEKAIRKIFNFQDDNSSTSMAAGALVAVAAVKNAKKIGSSTAKGINMAKGGAAKFGQALKNDKSKFAQSKLGKSINSKLGKAGEGLQKGMGKVGDKLGALSDGFKKSGMGQALGKANNWIGEKGKNISNRIDKFKKGHPNFIKGAKTIGSGIGKGAKFVGKHGVKAAQFAQRNGRKILRRSMPIALGMMGAAMTYATGADSAMTALNVGSALNKGTEQFFESTTGTIATEKAELAEFSADAAYEEEQFAMDSADDAIRDKEDEMARKSGEEPSRLSGNAIQENAMDELKQAQWKAKLEEPDLGPDASDEERERQQDEKALAGLYLQRASLGERSESKEAFRQAYLNKDNIDGLSRTASHKTEDIMAKKNALLQKILELKASRSREDGQVDGDSTNMLSDKDVSSADRAMKSITDSIDRSVVGAGGTRDLSKILQRNLGLEDDGSAEYQAIMGAALDYRRASIAASAEKIDGKAGSVGIEEDALTDATYRRIYGAKS